MESREHKPFSGIVKEKGEDWRGLTLSLEIPAMESKHPVIVADVPLEAWTVLVVGEAVNVVLERQNLKKDKSGNPNSGVKEWHYYWGWHSFANADQAVGAQKEASIAVATAGSQDRQVAIMMQTCLKVAASLNSGGETTFSADLTFSDQAKPALVKRVLDDMEALYYGLVRAINRTTTPPLTVSEASPILASGPAVPAVAATPAPAATLAVPPAQTAITINDFWSKARSLFGSGEDTRKKVADLFDGDIVKWIQADGERSWGSAWEVIRVEANRVEANRTDFFGKETELLI